jgi:hypothetical protein
VLIVSALAAVHFYGPDYVCHGGEYSDCEYETTGEPIIIFIGKIGGFLNAISPAVTAIATALLAYITWALTKASERQAAISRDMHEARRAFVYVSAIVPSWEAGSAKTGLHSFRPQWGNSGETQTVGMQTSVNAEFIDYPLSDDFPFGGPHNIPAFAMLGPRSSITGGNARSLSNAEMQQVVDGTKFLYLWGWTTYNDIFGGGHITRYCYQVQAFGDADKVRDGPTVFNVLFLFQPRGNCADDECKIYN